MQTIKCKCGEPFNGLEGKEDTCPECLKKVIAPSSMKPYKVEMKATYWHVVLSHGVYSDYTEKHLFFTGNDETEVWGYLCQYIEENITEENMYLWGSDFMALKWNDEKYLSPKYTGDLEDVSWSDAYNVNKVSIEKLGIVYFKKSHELNTQKTI